MFLPRRSSVRSPRADLSGSARSLASKGEAALALRRRHLNQVVKRIRLLEIVLAIVGMLTSIVSAQLTYRECRQYTDEVASMKAATTALTALLLLVVTARYNRQWTLDKMCGIHPPTVGFWQTSQGPWLLMELSLCALHMPVGLMGTYYSSSFGVPVISTYEDIGSVVILVRAYLLLGTFLQVSWAAALCGEGGKPQQLPRKQRTQRAGRDTPSCSHPTLTLPQFMGIQSANGRVIAKFNHLKLDRPFTMRLFLSKYPIRTSFLVLGLGALLSSYSLMITERSSFRAILVSEVMRALRVERQERPFLGLHSSLLSRHASSPPPPSRP